MWNFFWMEKDHKKSGSWYTVKVFWLSSALIERNWAQNTANSSCKVSASALNFTHTFPGVTTSCGFLARWTLVSGSRTHLWALPQQEAYKRFMIKARIFLIIKDLSYPSGQTISLTLYIYIYLPSSFQVAALTSDLLTHTFWVSPGCGNTFPGSWQLAQNWQKLSVTFSYTSGLQRPQAWSLTPEPGPQITQVLVVTWKGKNNLKVIDQRTSMHMKTDPDKVCS